MTYSLPLYADDDIPLTHPFGIPTNHPKQSSYFHRMQQQQAMVAAGNEVKQLSKDKIELKNEIDTIADLTRENERLKWEAKSAQEETLRVKVIGRLLIHTPFSLTFSSLHSYTRSSPLSYTPSPLFFLTHPVISPPIHTLSFLSYIPSLLHTLSYTLSHLSLPPTPLHEKMELEKTKHEFIPALKESTLRLEQQVKMRRLTDTPS